MSTTGKALALRLVRALPPAINPLAVLRDIDQGARLAIITALELAATAHEIGPADPPAELRDAFRAAGAEFRLPAELLEAVSATLTRFDPAFVDGGRAGVMGLPAGDRIDGGPERHVRAAAHVLSIWSAADGLAGALRKYAGDELAAVIAGNFAILAARSLGTDGRRGIRLAAELLADVSQ